MLCLDRKKDEKISIGDDIEVTVVRVGGGYCKLGITAPKDVKILREELRNRSPREKPARLEQS